MRGTGAPSPIDRDPGEADELLLIARLRTGTAIVLFSISLFTMADLFVRAQALGALLAIKAVQLSILFAALWLLRRKRRGLDPRPIGTALVCVIYVTSALSAIERRDLATTCGLFLALSMGTASFLPWGAKAQVISVVVGAVSLVVNYALVDEAAAGSALLPAIATVVAFVASIWIARNTELHRTERSAFEMELEASRRRLEEESWVSGALARMGREMITSASEPEILDRVCALTAELLGCDTSTAALREDEGAAFVVRSSLGYAPDDTEAMRFVRAPRPLVARLIEVFENDRLVELRTDRISDPTAASLHREYGVTTSLYLPLRRGRELIGVLSAHYREREEKFSKLQRRVAMGIAHLASMALENARLVDQLRSVNQLKSEFVSTMSHELRTPVSVILGYTEMLSDRETSAEGQALLGRVRRAAVELNELIEETLDLSRLEAGKDPPRVERVPVRDLFEEIVTEFAAVTPLDRVAVRWEGTGAEIRSDRRKLRIILKNLVGNALKFTTEGEIVVRGRLLPGAAEIAVADTGVGIAPEHLPIIFDMFRQADSSDARSYRGVGLGLYIVRRLAEELGGEVSVESVVGKGTKFVVLLPQFDPADLLEAGRDETT
jgi:signal transduction histidine kinase